MLNPEHHFRHLWESVRVERSMPYTLFTFGQTDLPYYLVVAAENAGEPVGLTKGDVTITRPSILTPDNVRPEFRGFFEQDEGPMVDFLLARGMSFPHLKFANRSSTPDMISDSVEEIVARLKRRIDDDDDDRSAILTAPHGLGGLALVKYAVEKAVESAPGNIQELRERGLLP
jgi:hypothetical protein